MSGTNSPLVPVTFVRPTFVRPAIRDEVLPRTALSFATRLWLVPAHPDTFFSSLYGFHSKLGPAYTPCVLFPDIIADT